MTNWYPFPQPDRHWLLGNGSILENPDLERSESYRRARVAGNQATADYYNSSESIIHRWLKGRAKLRKTYLWMRSDQQDTMFATGVHPNDANAGLFLTQPLENGRSKQPTQVYWTFRHPTLPIQAQVLVTAQTTKTGLVSNHQVQTSMVVPDTRLDRLNPAYFKVLGADFLGMHKKFEQGGDDGIRAAAKLINALETNQPSYFTEVTLGTLQYKSEREAAKTLLETLRWGDSLENLHIFDARPGEDDWLVLDLVDTNYSGTIATDLIEYLTMGPTIEKALEHYNSFCEVLQSLGVIFPKVAESQIQRLLLAGDDAQVRLVLGPSLTFEGEKDKEHMLHVHLTTGTFSVSCSAHDDTNKAEVASSWMEAEAIASITGRQTELAAYAAEFARTRDDNKARTLVRRRKAGLVTPN